MGNRGYSQYYSTISIFIDLIMLNLSFFLIDHWGLWSKDIQDQERLIYLGLVNTSFLIITILFPPINLFDSRRLSILPIAKYEFFKSMGLAVINLLILRFISDKWVFTIFIHFGVFFILVLLIREVAILGILYYRKQGFNYRNVIMVSHGTETSEFEEYLKNNPQLGYRVNSNFDIVSLTKSDNASDDFVDLLRALETDEVLINTRNLKKEELELLLDICDKNFLKARLITSYGADLNRKVLAETINDHVLVEVSPHPLENPYSRLLKRVFDLLFGSFVSIFILSWLYPVIAIMIKTESDGPVIFRQLRTGMRGDEFICYKFRTMYQNHNQEERQAIVNDSRVTKVGRFLRKTSLDEFPQFWNVIKGDMSVVGPRPHMIAHTKEFAKLTKHYFDRHNIKPGITGLAQVNGFRGEIKNQEDLEGRIKWDRRYVENWSLTLDLRIIVKTLHQIVSSHPRAY